MEERLKQHIIDGERIGLEDALTEGLGHYKPLQIVNTYLLDGMKVVENCLSAKCSFLRFAVGRNNESCFS